MTVGELIEHLEWFDADLEIRMAQPTHNYWHEITARSITGIDEVYFAGEDDTIYDSVEQAIENHGSGKWTVILCA